MVRKCRDVGHVNPAADNDPAFHECRSAIGTSEPTEAKMIAASSFSGGAWSEPPAQTQPNEMADFVFRRRPDA